jgi:hypothetical protein
MTEGMTLEEVRHALHQSSEDQMIDMIFSLIRNLSLYTNRSTLNQIVLSALEHGVENPEDVNDAFAEDLVNAVLAKQQSTPVQSQVNTQSNRVEPAKRRGRPRRLV